MSIRVENLFYSHMRGTPFEKEALIDVSIELKKGDFIGIIGHTGCGKSTLVQHLNGILRPETGRVYIDEQLINNANIREIRRKVGLVFQYPEYQLFEETVFKDIAFGLKRENLTEAQMAERVLEAAEIVGLDKSILDKSIYEISGGQKRRCAIAGVIVMKPEYLILDEPAAGLDPAGRDEILAFIKKLNKEKGVTVVLVSHSMDDIARLTDYVVVMNKGRVVMTGCPREIFMQADKLDEIGLSIPQVTRLMCNLKKINPDIREDILTIEEAKEEILRHIRSKR